MELTWHWPPTRFQFEIRIRFEKVRIQKKLHALFLFMSKKKVCMKGGLGTFGHSKEVGISVDWVGVYLLEY